jgi:hypothetical protein
MDNLNNLLARPDTALWGAVLSTLLLIAVLIVLAWRRHARHNQLARLLRSLGGMYVRDLIIPDGVGGTIQTDYLVLLRGGVLVLDVKNYRGALFGAENAPLWSQMVRARSFKFTNPLPENFLRVQSLKLLLPNVPVTGRVVFTREGHFPRDMPAGVSMLDTLVEDLGAFAGPASLQYLEVWKRLMAGEHASAVAGAVTESG